MNQKTIFLFCILSSNIILGQRFSGNNFGGYSGVYGIQDNPATFVNKKPKWDINLIGTGINIYSQYGYFQDVTALGAINRSIVDANDSVPRSFNSDEEMLFYADPYSSPINGFLINHISNLPSVALNIGNISVGLFTNLRSHVDNTDAPIFLNYQNLKKLEDNTPYTISPTTINAMLWGEVGAHFGYQHTLNNDNKLALGINVKKLIGFESMYLRLNNDYNFVRVRDSFISDYANLDVGFATGISRGSNNYSFGSTGSGWGFDLGVEYLLPNNDPESSSLHYMKFGAAIKDIGSIHFDQNAETHKFVTDDVFKVVNNITDNRSYNYEIVKRLSESVFSDSLESKTGRSFTMYTPMSLNLHWDYNFRPDFYMNAFVTRRINTLKTQLSAPNVIMLSARYEKRWFEGGMSASLTEDRWFGIGAYVKLGLLTIGSDHINTFLFAQPKFRGTDIYFSLKIMPFGSGGNKDEAAERFTNKGTKRANCPSYR